MLRGGRTPVRAKPARVPHPVSGALRVESNPSSKTGHAGLALSLAA